ncbi:MAG TPA: hypothetical protein VHQ41_01740, partial [Patescibacteria group bacterium]|nr:hypothetical protein [Patescibacteria group bacterium]
MHTKETEITEMAKTIYLNLEDDVAKIINSLKREKTAEAVLVFPKKSFIFSDSINLRLLKKQVDMLGKKVSILTMDERGQMYAQEAGFELKRLPAKSQSNSFSDIRPRTTRVPATLSSPAPMPPAPVAASPRAVTTLPKLQRKKIIRTVETPERIAPARVATTAAAAMAPTVPRRPNVNASTETRFASVRNKDNVFIPPDSKVTKPKHRKSYRAYVVGFISIALVVVLLLVLVVLPSASIIVYAKSQTVARDIDIIADVKAQTADSSKLSVPAVAVDENQTIADTFQTNGKKELGSKAEGRVALYNLTGSPMALKAATTTLKVGDKTYSFKQDQPTVKALTSASNDSNATVADIIASEGGEAYNVPAGTRVEISNQAFGSQPQRLYAKTVTQVIGGNSRFISAISKDDLDNAQKELTKRVVDGINANLAGSNKKLVEGAYNVSVTAFTADKAVDTEAQSFSAQLQVSITGLAF